MSLDATIAGANADTLGTLAEALTYFEARGVAAWLQIESDNRREQLLRTAMDYMTGFYGGSWKGTRTTATQRLDWPRFGVALEDAPSGYGTFPYYVDWNTIPSDVKEAQFELALLALSAPLAPNIERVPIKEEIGEIKVTYDSNAPAYTLYRAVELKLAKYRLDASMTAKLVRT